MGKKKPVDWARLVPQGSEVWANALRLSGTVANDNGPGYQRRSSDRGELPVLQLHVVTPKAS